MSLESTTDFHVLLEHILILVNIGATNQGIDLVAYPLFARKISWGASSETGRMAGF
jgi:hypothetical protein